MKYLLIKLAFLQLLSLYAYGSLYKQVFNYDVKSEFSEYLICKKTWPNSVFHKQKFNCLTDCSLIDDCQSVSLSNSCNASVCSLFKKYPSFISKDMTISAQTSIYIKMRKLTYGDSCSIDKDCDDTLGLVCVNYKCDCRSDLT